MKTEETISGRILLRLKETGMIKAAVARELKVRAQNFSNWISRNSVPKEYLHELSVVLSVNLLWLQFGEGEKLLSQNDSLDEGHPHTNIEHVKPKRDEFVIPQHEDVFGSMGEGLVLPEQHGQITSWRVTKEWAQHNIPSNSGRKNLRIVTGFGSSMKPMFHGGDAVLIDVGVKEVKYDHVYFFRIGDEGFIKILARIPGEGIKAIPKNPDYPTFLITKDMDFEVLGAVLKVWTGKEV